MNSGPAEDAHILPQPNVLIRPPSSGVYGIGQRSRAKVPPSTALPIMFGSDREKSSKSEKGFTEYENKTETSITGKGICN